MFYSATTGGIDDLSRDPVILIGHHDSLTIALSLVMVVALLVVVMVLVMMPIIIGIGWAAWTGSRPRLLTVLFPLVPKWFTLGPKWLM